MHRTRFAALLLGPLAALYADEPLSESSARIIYILADDLGYGDFSCFGKMTSRSLKQP
jgi:hypothetical protein